MDLGPIIIYEDDREEQELLDAAFKHLQVPNPVLYFSDGEELLHYLGTTTDKPHLIISEVRVSKIDGMELKQRIEQDENLRKKSIPFIYLTTSVRKVEVDKAYDLTVQGFFKKQSDINSIIDELRMIVDYWGRCYHPNSLG